jgi:hypothetical protein
MRVNLKERELRKEELSMRATFIVSLWDQSAT